MRRRWITFLRIFRYGIHNFTRNAWLSTAATAVMTITLLIIATTVTTRMIFNDTISQIRQKIDISVYLKDDITDKELARFSDEIKAVPVVTSVEHVTKAQARAIFERDHKDQLTQLEALGELGNKNPFPASLTIKTKDPNNLGELNKVINSKKNQELQSDKPSYSGARKNAIDKIAQASQFLETGGLAAAAVFMVISVMIIFNTIRMAIFNRRDEIEIMKLIGADKRFIRGPFIIEAALYGVLAAVISIAVVYIVLLTQTSGLGKYDIEVQHTIEFFKAWPILIVPAQILAGIIIGIFSSLLAMRRYLKV